MVNIAAIILAAGRGTRMNSKDTNKVMSDLNGRPMLSYSIDNLKRAGVETIVVVVGFARESIINYFGNKILYAYQDDPTGTAHAVLAGVSILPNNIDQVLSVYGDDSYLYNAELLKKLCNIHISKNADVTMLTVEMDDPSGLGRILRDDTGNIMGIVEEKVASDDQKNIHEINTGCFVFRRKFLDEFLPKIKKNEAAQEYYLTDIVEIAVKNNKKIEAYAAGKIPWRGVNRPEELEEARKLVHNT